MIDNQPNEITLIYHSDKAEDKKARGFIETISGFKVKTLDLKRDRLTETLLAQIAHMMSISVGLLLDTTYKDRFQSISRQHLLMVSDSDLLTIMVNEPVLINTPIIIVGKRAYSYSSANELLIRNQAEAEKKTAQSLEKKISF